MKKEERRQEKKKNNNKMKMMKKKEKKKKEKETVGVVNMMGETERWRIRARNCRGGSKIRRCLENFISCSFMKK